MNTMKGLRQDLEDLRNSLRSTKGGLGNYKPSTKADQEWFDYTNQRFDDIREKINKMLERLDGIIG